MIDEKYMTDLMRDNTLSFLTGLDDLATGFFILDQQGNMIQYNDTTVEIFAIEEPFNWDTLHISKIDCILSTGLAEEFDELINHQSVFSKKNIACTNRLGKFMTINITCRIHSIDEGNEKYVIGFIEDVERKNSASNVNITEFQGLQVLSEVAAALSSVNELEKILNVILTGATASQGLGFNRAFLFMYDSQNKILKGHLAVGPSSPEEAGYIWEELEGMCLSLPELFDNDWNKPSLTNEPLSRLIKNFTIDLKEESLISKVCHEAEWINISELENFDSVTKTFTDTLGTAKIALAPMVSKGKLTGLLAADNSITGEPLSDNSIQLLQILANQGAVAMERAALYEEQKERSNQLEKMNDLLAESQEHIIKIEKMSVIGELTSSIAHELRNPLTIVGGFAGLMLNSGTNDEQREYLSIITSEIKRAEAVLDQVLDFSKASKSDSELINFNKLIEKTLNLILSRQRQSDLNIPLSLEQKKLVIFGNYDQLAHAFYQFFRLVVEDLMPTVNAEARIERNNDKALLQIRLLLDDDHREYSMKAIKQIFTASKTSQRLTILVASEAIRFHGGDFGLSFDSDKNPTLYIELPLAKEVSHETVTADS